MSQIIPQALVFLFLISQAFAFTSDPIEIKNRYAGGDAHIVFLVHGLAGDRATFGGLERVLRDRYGKRLVVRHLTYDTVEKSEDRTDDAGWLTVDEFKLQAYVKLVDFLYDRTKRGLVTNESPSFSIISHSQGGLVVRDLLKDCLYPDEVLKASPCSYKEGLTIGSLKDRRAERNKGFYEDLEQKEKFGKALVHFLGMKHWFIYGTPFGGSPQASKLFGGIIAAFKKALDSEESRDLKNGSEVLVADRDDLIDLAIAKRQGKRLDVGFRSELEIYTFGGDIAEIRDKGKRFAFARELLSNGVETDVVVPISSSRLDMIYFREDPSSREWSDATKGVTDFSAAYFPIKMPHRKLGRMDGMISAELVTNGPDDESYEHVGLDILAEILDVFFGDSETADFGRPAIRTQYVESLDNFSVELKILPAEGYERLPNLTDGAVRVSTPEGVPIPTPVFEDGLFYKVSGLNKEAVTGERTHTSFYHWGRFSESEAFLPMNWLTKNLSWRPETSFSDDPSEYPYRLNYFIYERMGWHSRSVILPVAPTYMTYAEVYLTPFLPIRPIGTRLGTPEGISGELNYEDGRVLGASDLLRDQFPEGAHVVGAYDLDEDKTRLFLTSPSEVSREVRAVDVTRRQLFRELGSKNSGHLQKLRIRKTEIRGSVRKMQCKVGHFAEAQKRHLNAIFDRSESDEINGFMENGDSVEIIGRVIKKDAKSGELDFYMVTSEKIREKLTKRGRVDGLYPFAFASRYDIDIDKGQRCAYAWLP